MDDSSEKNLGELETIGKEFLEKEASGIHPGADQACRSNRNVLDEFAEKLSDEKHCRAVKLAQKLRIADSAKM